MFHWGRKKFWNQLTEMRMMTPEPTYQMALCVPLLSSQNDNIAQCAVGQVTNDVIGGIGWARKLKVFILYRKPIFT